MKPAPSHDAAKTLDWKLHPEFAEQLGPEGIRLDEWLRTGQATVVKEGPHRKVYRVALKQLTFYLKQNNAPERLAWLQQLIRPSKARREYSSLREAKAREIPTAQPLGWVSADGGASWLATSSLDETTPFYLFAHMVLPTLPAAAQAKIRLRLCVELGRLVARLHDAGLQHNDIHEGNILVRLNEEKMPELFLIDLNQIRFGPPLDLRKSLKNLVILNYWFALQATRGERFRFWLAYLEARPRLLGHSTKKYDARLRECACKLETATWQALLRFWRKRDKRSLASNRYYRCVSKNEMAGHAVTHLNPALVEQLLRNPDTPFEQPGATLLKDSGTSTVVELDGVVAGKTRRLIFKRFRIKKSATPWTSLVRMPPALRSWQIGHGFFERGLPTPRPLLVLHRRRHGLFHEGYLLMEKIEHAQHLHECLDQAPVIATSHRADWLRSRIHRVGLAVRELHRRNVSHRDLKANNIFVGDSLEAPPPPAEKPATSLLPKTLPGVWFIDLVGVTLGRRLSRSRKVQNLARLNASFHWRPEITRTDRLRFLRAYLTWGLYGKQYWKRWWKSIAAATDTKMARNARLGRGLA